MTREPGALDRVVTAIDRVSTATGWLAGWFAIIAPGFVLKQIEEPRPSEEYCRAHPSQRGWRDHVALFLYFCAETPAVLSA